VSWVAAGAWTNWYGTYPNYYSHGGFAEGQLAEAIPSSTFNLMLSEFTPYQQGFDASAGNVHWAVIPSPGSTGDHIAYGDAMPLAGLPTSGAYSFTHVGGTAPTNNEGKAGAITSGGTFNINFGSQTASFSGLHYWVPGPSGSGVSSVTYMVSGSGSTSGSGSGSMMIDCNPCYNTTYMVSNKGETGWWSGTGFGANMQGAAVAVATGANVVGSNPNPATGGGYYYPQQTATTQVYKRQ